MARPYSPVDLAGGPRWWDLAGGTSLLQETDTSLAFSFIMHSVDSSMVDRRDHVQPFTYLPRLLRQASTGCLKAEPVPTKPHRESW